MKLRVQFGTCWWETVTSLPIALLRRRRLEVGQGRAGAGGRETEGAGGLQQAAAIEVVGAKQPGELREAIR